MYIGPLTVEHQLFVTRLRSSTFARRLSIDEYRDGHRGCNVLYVCCDAVHPAGSPAPAQYDRCRRQRITRTLQLIYDKRHGMLENGCITPRVVTMSCLALRRMQFMQRRDAASVAYPEILNGGVYPPSRHLCGKKCTQ